MASFANRTTPSTAVLSTIPPVWTERRCRASHMSSVTAVEARHRPRATKVREAGSRAVRTGFRFRRNRSALPALGRGDESDDGHQHDGSREEQRAGTPSGRKLRARLDFRHS